LLAATFEKPNQTIGPIANGFGFLNIGIPTLRASAVVIMALGFIGARSRKQIRPTDAKVT
jgi:hypothetical protein